jgi:hypothetical protein
MVLIGLDWLEYQHPLKLLGNFEEAVKTFSYWITELRERGDIGVFSTPVGCLLGDGLDRPYGLNTVQFSGAR